MWVDAGSGDETVIIEPQVSFLPDKSDPFGLRNDSQETAAPLNASGNLLAALEPLTGSRLFTKSNLR